MTSTPTPEQIAEIRAAQRGYEDRLENIYTDMLFEFELKYGWSSEEVEDYFRRYA